MKKNASPESEYIKTSIYLPLQLREDVKAAAKASGRTMNAEILARVMDAEERMTLKELLRQNAELARMMREMLDAIELLK